MRLGLRLFGVLAVCLARGEAAAGTDLGELGTFAKWSKVEIVLTGPASKGNGDDPNPFRIRVDVVFSGPAGSQVVPAFYDGDGSGGMDGAVWKVRFSPDAAGSWSFFSLSTDDLLHGYEGRFQVSEPAGCAAYAPGALPDFSCVGRLVAVGEHHLKYAEGPYWLKGGEDDPEDFLAPAPQAGFPTHAEAIDYLASQGANSLYFMTHNLDGDGDNVFPWVGRDDEHFDVARLAEWEAILSHLQSQGLVLHVVLEDDSGWAGFDRVLYYRTLVARFAHHNGLVWNLSEEYNENYSPSSVSAFAGLLRALDPYDHPITIHNAGGLENWEALLGDTSFDLTSFQTGKAPQNAVAASWFDDVETAGHVIALSFDETGQLGTADRDLARHIAWSAYTGGASFELHTSPLADYRDFEAHLQDLTRARTFMEGLPFWRMRPSNALLTSGTGYVFAAPGEAYVVYLPLGGAMTLDLSADTASFDASWFDPRDGTTQSLGVQSGGAPLALSAPDTTDWALRLRVSGSGTNVVPTANHRALAVAPGAPADVALTFGDPDGPGPHVFSVVQFPGNGSLSDDDGDSLLVYTPDPGYTGPDVFTWSVSDGVAASNVATVSLDVRDPANRPPVAVGRGAVTEEGEPIEIRLLAGDPDGAPGQFSMVDFPGHGSLSGLVDGNRFVTYTPDPGFGGLDRFTFRVQDAAGAQSEVAEVEVRVEQAGVAFRDDFERPDAPVLGDRWVEIEDASDDAGVQSGRLTFIDVTDDEVRPLLHRSFPAVSTGTLSFDFEFDWTRLGTEEVYLLLMQLGEGDRMRDVNLDLGAAVNLVWTRIGVTDEQLGYREGGAVSPIAVVSGPTDLSVVVDFDVEAYDVWIDGAPVATAVPFEEDVPIDTLRVLTDSLNGVFFSGRSFDALRIEAADLDRDGDGLRDLDERDVHGTAFIDPDSDGDGLSDGDELASYATNPLLADSDGDGFSDGEEVALGTDPNDPAEFPAGLPALGPPALALLMGLLAAVALATAAPRRRPRRG